MITNSNDLKSSLSFFHWFSNTENIFQHRSFFKMRLLFAIYFIVNVLALLVVLVRARQQSCTTNHCGEISKDIKTLHTEVKNLVALVKALCVRSLQVPFRIISMGSSFNFVIFPMFSMRSDFKIALLSSSQSIPSLLARSSTT